MIDRTFDGEIAREPENAERFRIMADASPLMIWVTDASGGMEFVNRAYTEFFGVTAREVRASGWQPLVHPEDAGKYEREFELAMRERRLFRCKARVKRHDGEWRWIDSFGAPRIGPDGEVVGCVGSSPDITELIETRAEAEAARAQAEAANRERDEAIAMISHELRTPMTVISGWTAMLAAADLDEETLRVAVQSIQSSGRVLQKLVDDLLDLGRITGRKLTIEPQPVDLAAVIRGAAEMIATAADAKNITLHISVPEAVSVPGDMQRLQQVLVNLLSNAVKFTGPHGHVFVDVAAAEESAVISVRDTGRGITPEFLRHVFKRFAQQERGGGLGLGLAISREIVELHGGTITVESEGEGKGATFTVRLRTDNPAAP